MTLLEKNILDAARYYRDQMRRYANERQGGRFLIDCVAASHRLTTLVHLSHVDEHGLSEMAVDELFALEQEAREILSSLH